MVFVFGCWCDRNYLVLQMCLLYCCNAIIYNVCSILNINNSAFTLKTQTACIYATLIGKSVLGISLLIVYVVASILAYKNNWIILFKSKHYGPYVQ